MSKRIILLAAALLLVFSVSFAAHAHDVPDLTRSGSILVNMQYNQQPVSGGSLTLYRVGEVAVDNGNYSFRAIEDFAEFEGTLTDLQSPELAKRLADYALSKDLSSITIPIKETGRVEFTNLELGLYLLVQEQAAQGYSKATPFLVSLPKMENGVYVYQVDASPKTELIPVPTDPQPEEPKLPQTGQLNWPIPVLTVLGLGLFIAGWILLCKKERYEK